MKSSQKWLSIVLLTVILGANSITGCSSSDPINSETNQNDNQEQTNHQDQLDITVSIIPQKYFVKKIGGDRVKVNVMVQQGAVPDTYEPKPQQLQALSEAEAYIGIGVPFETVWMNRISQANPKLLTIDSSEGIERLTMTDHDHGDDHDHNEDENTLDPHIWLSPRLVKIQAQKIYETLVTLDPKYQEMYQNNLNNFLQEIEELDDKIKEHLADLKQRKFIVFHPAWGYFAEEYNLTQVPVEVGGQEPSAAELGNLIKEAKKENIKVIFAQPELSSQAAKTIAKEINGEVLLISPVAEDWSSNLLEVSQTFEKVLKKENN
ncbi:metal ABC transporter solute-binding protein, Zn/Mn family [Crocosphaera chwakensis]|uniref:Periplasmic binding protein component of an ABC type zinc uptake transporter n=1 Tax=Crocosphaera chwakensis CCY0110 TaxID=391612 RepID=A3INI7_9CHRO|nr:zinc ABC transporter substrate-binding protein [Crocosphaera chwakensis]EAZ91885.1 periplasmic binding protein component of an ABC type zinc uptake transporter [Crocosphaera chwakensis CCY0110]